MAAAIPDLLSGSAHIVIEAFASFRPHLQSGKVRALITATHRDLRCRSGRNPEEFAAVIRADMANWTRILKHLGIRAG